MELKIGVWIESVGYRNWFWPKFSKVKLVSKAVLIEIDMEVAHIQSSEFWLFSKATKLMKDPDDIDAFAIGNGQFGDNGKDVTEEGFAEEYWGEQAIEKYKLFKQELIKKAEAAARAKIEEIRRAIS